MIESQRTYALLRELRKRMPDAEIDKYNDRSTKGIPDFSVVWDGITTWFEVKLTSNKKMFEPIQYEKLRRRMRGWYLFINDYNRYELRHIVTRWPYQTHKPAPGLTFAEGAQEIVKICRTD